MVVRLEANYKNSHMTNRARLRAVTQLFGPLHE